MLKYSVGLDISSKKINACICVIDAVQKVTINASTTVSNTTKGFEGLVAWMQKHYKDKEVRLVVCMEATGVYYENCALFLSAKAFQVSVILPNKAKRYFQSLGLKSKNDSIDAKGLAQMGAEQYLKIWHPIAKYFYELRTLTRQHQNLQQQRTLFNNQLHALEFGMYRNRQVEKQIEKMIALIDKQIEQTGKQIKPHLESDEEVMRKVNNIAAIKGVGLLTIATILAETNGFILFENTKQLVSYAGYDVVENQSGKHNGRTKISKRGNSRIRRCLFMPALSVVTHKQAPFLSLYSRTFEKHKVKMKSYVAVQKRLLTTIFALWKRDEIFDENHMEKSKEQETELPLCSSAQAEVVGIENKIALA